jgi:hypothetical protein
MLYDKCPLKCREGIYKFYRHRSIWLSILTCQRYWYINNVCYYIIILFGSCLFYCLYISLQKNSTDISIGFLHRKLAYGAPYRSSIELHRTLWRIPMELHRNSMELRMLIFYEEIFMEFSYWELFFILCLIILLSLSLMNICTYSNK